MSTSRSSNQSQANQTQVTETTNLNLQDTSGITIGSNSGSLALTTTDFDAVSMAGELGLEALDLGRRSVDNVVDFAGRGVDSIIGATRDVNRDSLDFGEKALSTIADLAENNSNNIFDFAGRSTRDALDFGVSSLGAVKDANRDSLDFADQALSTVTSALGDAGAGVLDFAKGLVQDTVSGLNSLSMQTSASTDDRVAKVAMYAFGAVAALVILPAVFKK